jgi:hypothetical protein
MEPTTAPRHAESRGSFRRLLVAAGLVAVLLSGASGAAATSLVAVHAPGGPDYVRITSLASDQDLTVSRSVGLMEGAAGSPADADLGASHVDVSRSVGLMTGASGTTADAELGSAPIQVSRSVGLMVGAAS